MWNRINWTQTLEVILVIALIGLLFHPSIELVGLILIIGLILARL